MFPSGERPPWASPQPLSLWRAATHRSCSGRARRSQRNPQNCSSARETWDLSIVLHKAQALLPWLHGGSADEGAVKNPTPPGHGFRARPASSIQRQFYFLSFDGLQRVASLLHGGVGMAAEHRLLLLLTARLHFKKQLKYSSSSHSFRGT